MGFVNIQFTAVLNIFVLLCVCAHDIVCMHVCTCIIITICTCFHIISFQCHVTEHIDSYIKIQQSLANLYKVLTYITLYIRIICYIININETFINNLQPCTTILSCCSIADIYHRKK